MKIIIASHFSKNNNICEYLLHRNPDFKVTLMQEESELNDSCLESLNPGVYDDEFRNYPHFRSVKVAKAQLKLLGLLVLLWAAQNLLVGRLIL